MLPFGLLFGEDDLDSIRSKAETSWGAKLMASLRTKAEDLVGEDIDPAPKHPVGLTGQAEVLAFVGLVDGRDELQEAAKARMLVAAGLDEWLRNEILRYGMATSSAALALDWGWDAYSKDEAARVLDAIIGCAIDNGDPEAPINKVRLTGPKGEYTYRPLVEYLDYESENPFHAWQHSTNNWDVVIGNGLMSGWGAVHRAVNDLGMTLGATRDLGFEVDGARLDRWYNVAKQRFMNFTTRCFSHAGQYSEGPNGYYTYGLENCLSGLEVARRVGGEDLYSTGLLRSPFWQRELYPWGVADGAQNLSDADLPGHPGAHVIARLAARTESPWMQGYFIKLVEILDPERRGGLGTAQSLIWADENLPAEDFAETKGKGVLFSDFGDTGDIVGRTGRDIEDDIQWIFRCGKWNGAHTHKDRGHIVLSAFGERLLVDSGRMKDYGREEHKTYHTKSPGHNVVLVGGEGQLGYNPFPTWARTLRSRRGESGRATVVGEMKMCYARTAAAIRAVHFDPEGFLVVLDHYEAAVDRFTQLWHLDNRDGDGRVESSGEAIRLVRPKASLVVLPLIGPYDVETAPGWIGMAEGGSIDTKVSRPDGRFLTVLVALKEGDDFEYELASAGEGDVKRVAFTVRGASHVVEAGASWPAFTLDGTEFEFSQEVQGLPG